MLVILTSAKLPETQREHPPLNSSAARSGHFAIDIDTYGGGDNTGLDVNLVKEKQT